MESLSTTVLGSEFHTEGAEQRKARFASCVIPYGTRVPVAVRLVATALPNLLYFTPKNISTGSLSGTIFAEFLQMGYIF